MGDMREALLELYQWCCDLNDFRPDSRLGRKVKAALYDEIQMSDKTECGCTDECQQKPDCVFERDAVHAFFCNRSEIKRLQSQIAEARKALEATRMQRGRAIYLAVYETQGADWRANECKELWAQKADRYLELLAQTGETGK